MLNRVGGVAMGRGPKKYDSKTTLSVDRETWTKFRGYCKEMNMTPADTINLMIVAAMGSSQLEGLFNMVVDRIVEEKEKQTRKTKEQK